MKPKQSIEEKFDEKFGRIGLNTKTMSDEMWIKHGITTKEIKNFYNKEISKLLGDIVGKRKQLSDPFDLCEDNRVFNHNEKRQECIEIIKASPFKELV